jgi:hypothetical protein
MSHISFIVWRFRYAVIAVFLLCLFSTLANAQSIPSTPGWFQIPNTKLADVCAYTHGFSQVGGAEGCPAITADWSGGVFDTQRNRLIIWGGGHNGYYGNELYALDLNTSTMQRLSAPGLPIGTYDTCQDAIVNGTQPNSRHTYDGIEYLPNIDGMWAYGGALACGLGGVDLSLFPAALTWIYHFDTQMWENRAATGAFPDPRAGLVSAYDPNTGKVFIHDLGKLYTYTYAMSKYEQVNSASEWPPMDYHMNAAIDPKRKRLVIIGGGQEWIYDISTGPTYTRQALNSTGGSTIINSIYPGIDYDPVSDRMVAWNGGDTVYSLNLDTKQWTTTT